MNYDVKTGDTLSHIRRRFCGAPDDDNRLTEFFRQSPGQLPKDPGNLQVGTPLVIPIITVSTPLSPLRSAAEFVTGLKEVARGSVTIKEDAQSPGRIILPPDTDPQSSGRMILLPKEDTSSADNLSKVRPHERTSGTDRKDERREIGESENFVVPEFDRVELEALPVEESSTDSTSVVAKASASTAASGETSPAIAATKPAPLASSDAGAAVDTCKDLASGYPLDPVAIEKAYEHVSKGIVRHRVHLLVLDNGFFGVPCQDGSCPPYNDEEPLLSERFPKKLFDLYQFKSTGILGPWSRIQTNLHPINYQNEPFRDGPKPASLDRNSGHGTHVAGIALGGYSFENYRSVLDLDGGAWLQLVIGNVANGQGRMLAGAEEHLSFIFLPMVKRGAKKLIVNMSLAFDAGLDKTTRENFRATVSDNTDVLFVAAAGNDGKDLTNDLFPAALGGTKSINVLTVASIDADDRLSTFSNRSADRVDLAAPGCKIQSWWDTDGVNHAENGTSQAAPFVSFAGALVWSVWPFAQPIHIKKRLVYSTDLISSESGQQIWSHGKLNIAKALLIGQDLIRFKKDDKEIVFLGDVKSVEGFVCRDGHGSPNWEELNAFKRKADGTGWIYYSDTSEDLEICSGELASMIGEQTENKIFFVPKFQIVGNEFLPHEGREMEIDADDIIEIVRNGLTP